MRVEGNKLYLEINHDIGHLVIHDPPANKMTAAFLKEFIVMVRSHVTQSRLRGIIIRGHGRHYSSGADVEQLKEIVASQSLVDNEGNLIAYPTWYLDNRTTFDYFRSLNIPVISAINGLCYGSGLELALCSHIRISGKGSLLGLPESTFGFLPGVTGTLRSLELVGLGRALELVLKGETLTAEEALEIGLIHRVTGKKETLSYCEGLMEYILAQPTQYDPKRGDEYVMAFNRYYQENHLSGKEL